MRRLGMCTIAASLILALAAGLSGCGGGDGDAAAPPAPPPPAAIGADGGKIDVPGVATVVVPPGALDAQTTIRVAQDSSAAPPVPAWFTPAGPMVAITPHGATFTEQVTVRLPAPAVTLAAGERLLLAKAQPGGEWEVYSETELKDGQLEVQVNSFSIFVPVRVSYTVTPLSPPPFEMSATTLTCDGQPCATVERVRSTPMTATTTGNGGVFPTGCVNPKLGMRRLTTSSAVGLGASENATAAAVLQRSFTMPTDLRSFVSGRLMVQTQLYCTDPTTNAVSALSMSMGRQAVDNLNYPGPSLDIVEFPGSLIRAAGETTAMRAVLTGGASRADSFNAPTAADEARVFLERLSPGDSAWRIVSEHGQTSANPRPYNGRNWMYWSFDFALGPFTSADNGASYRVRACYQRPGSTSNTCKIGPVASLTIVQQAQAPSFVTQPRSMLIQPGQTASFGAQVTGTPVPTLQWQTRAGGGIRTSWNDVPANGTAVNYTTPPISLADNGVQYRLVATNGAGSVASDIVTLSVDTGIVAPAIGTQPASLSVVRNSEALFAVNATGTEALSYQWFKDGKAITGANAPQLKIANAADVDDGRYWVDVSNPAGSVTSASARLTVTTAAPAIVAPTIVTQPAAVAVTEGNVATFAVGVTGSGPMSFQWRKNGVDIDGANAAAYTLPAVAIADGGSYSVRVSNGAGNVTSQAATLVVVPAGGGVPVVQPPTIVANQDSIVVAVGMDAMFGVEAQGSGPLAYRWLRNGVPVPGQDGAIYVINGATALDAGSYQVEVSNSAGTVTSATSMVGLLGAPAITSQPAAASQPEATTAQFNVAVTGDALRYQWLRNNIAIPGATDSLYTTPVLTLADSGAVYSVIVYNGAGLVFSGGAVLTVTPEVIAPTVAQQPGDATVADGTPANLDVAFNGTPPFSVQFQRLVGGNWVDYTSVVPWSDNAMRRVATGNLSVADNGSQFRFIATNAAGSVTTRVVTVTVNAAPTAPVARIAAAFRHTCGVKTDGNAACWGNNGSAQIGTGNVNSPQAPYTWNLGETVVSVAAGMSASCALTASGRVFCAAIGFNGGSMTPVEKVGASGARQIVVGSGHMCVLAADRSVWCWGNGSVGQLGNGAVGGSSQPVQVQSAAIGAALGNVAALAAGDSHTCAVLGDGGVACWGYNIALQTGSPAGTDTTRAVAVQGLTGVDRLALGDGHSCALLTDTTVRCWGDNSQGQFGNGVLSTTPSAVPTAPLGLSGVLALASGTRHLCAVLTAGVVGCWGTGSMGNGNFSETRTSAVQVSGLSGVVALAAGFEHTCALRNDGQLACWGANGEGQLGLSGLAPRTTPAVLPGLTFAN